MTANLEAQEDLNAIEGLLQALHHHQLQSVLMLKEISSISPALARSFCACHISADCLRKVEPRKLMAIVNSSKPATALLKLKMDATHLKLLDEIHEELSATTLAYASEYLSQRS